jgi:hypothetical protein
MKRSTVQRKGRGGRLARASEEVAAQSALNSLKLQVTGLVMTSFRVTGSKRGWEPINVATQSPSDQVQISNSVSNTKDLCS